MEVNRPAGANFRRTVMSADEVLSASSHRPWPLPSRPWAMRQVWSKLLLAHWPIRPEVVAERLPKGLSLDTWEGEAWISVVPFFMPYMSIRGAPEIPAFSYLTEINVRTYVRVGAKPGVYFFSLDADNPIVVEVARRWYHLPYLTAKFNCQAGADEIRYAVERTDSRLAPAAFDASYRPTQPTRPAAADSLDDWLTARYALYTTNSRGRVMRADVTHKPWELAPAEAEIRVNTMARSHGLAVADTAPLLHYAEQVDVLAWNLTPAQ